MSDEEKHTKREFSEKFEELRWNLLNAYRPTLESPPQAFLLGGQSGAGKTTLHKIINRRLDGNGISINGDDYRKFHPRFLELQRIYGDEAVNYTAPWAGRMTEALIDSLSRIGYNLVIEGTLRTAEVPLKTAELLRRRGYGVSLALMAVKPEISLVSCQIRYEEMRVAGTTPRATDPAHHNKIIDQVVSNLGVLEASGMFDEIALYDRSQTRLFPREGAGDSAEEALRTILFGPWAPEERRHYNELKAKLNCLKTKQNPPCATNDERVSSPVEDEPNRPPQLSSF